MQFGLCYLPPSSDAYADESDQIVTENSVQFKKAALFSLLGV